jgi:methenyltetrahydromethanopterin cyclohydrolase
MTMSLNERALVRVDELLADGDGAGVVVSELSNGTRVVDCGSEARGGLAAGQALAEICMARLGTVRFNPVTLDGRSFPGLTVISDHPLLACLASQYAGWKIDHDGYFAMASGPGRALVRAEELYEDLGHDEESDAAVFVLETADLPTEAVAEHAAQRACVEPSRLTLLTARTASVAGSTQVAARVLETAMHKLHELEFDVRKVYSGYGTAPLAPVAKDDAEGIGRTNDAVLYGGQVWLSVDAADDELEGVVEKVPSSASDDYGEPFGDVLKAANYDFYEIDAMLFSPAQITLSSLQSGRSFQAGRVNLETLERSFWE